MRRIELRVEFTLLVGVAGIAWMAIVQSTSAGEKNPAMSEERAPVVSSPPCETAGGTIEKAIAPDRLDSAYQLYRSGMAAEAEGSNAQAESCYLRAIALVEGTPGVGGQALATFLNRLGLLYGSMGMATMAEPLHARAVAVLETAYGDDDPRAAVILSNLAVDVACQGRYSEAESLGASALAILEKEIDANPTILAGILYNLSAVSEYLGRDTLAVTYRARAQKLLETMDAMSP